MQSHAHAHLAPFGPLVLGVSPLGDCGGSQGRVCAGEGEEERVSMGVDLTAIARFRRLSQDAPVVGQNGAVPLPSRLSSRVDPSISVKRKVTVPRGSSATRKAYALDVGLSS
jgi:hypothetical protein